MRRLLLSVDGKPWYSRRKCTVEPVFGKIKSVMAFRHFMLRGAKHAHDELDLVFTAWDVKRMRKLMTARRNRTAFGPRNHTQHETLGWGSDQFVFSSQNPELNMPLIAEASVPSTCS